MGGRVEAASVAGAIAGRAYAEIGGKKIYSSRSPDITPIHTLCLPVPRADCRKFRRKSFRPNSENEGFPSPNLCVDFAAF